MAKKIRKTMTDAQLAAALDELNALPRIPRLRGGRATLAHNSPRRYDRKKAKQVDASMY